MGGSARHRHARGVEVLVKPRRLLIAFVVAAGIAGTATASEPRLVAQADLPLGTARRLQVDLAGGVRDLLAVTVVPGGSAARLIDQSPTFPVGAVTVAQARAHVPGAVVAINGGYFEAGFRPLGLVRIAGVDRHPRSSAGVLSGVVAIDGAGHLALLPREAELADAVAAFQAGPFVIDPGGVVGVGDRPASARRSLLAMDDHGRLLLLVTGALTLHQVAMLLHDQPQAFGMERVERALNLDGGPSAGLSLALDDPAWSSGERGPVRNILVFTPIP
jgi:hypothetical protein